MAPTPDVGKDIESICGKCGDVWHVVVAKVGDRIAKVLCKQCGVQHRYRPPGGTPRKAASRTTRSASATTKKTRAPRGPALPHPEVVADLSAPTQAYRLSERYEVGQRIDHPKFGVGVVESEIGRGKIQVCFPDARRVLVHEHVPIA